VVDILSSIIGLLILSPLLIILYLIGLFDTGSPLFKQMRLGKDKTSFMLVKFRTMKIETLSVPSHLNSQTNVTEYGKFLRKTKLDELPQLWNVLKGDMSLVGPRPGLINQEELTYERERNGVYKVKPGITGLAQIKQIDMSTPKLLAKTDANMIKTLTLKSYLKYIILTILGSGYGDRVK